MTEYQFDIRHPHAYLFKLAHYVKLDKAVAKKAWSLLWESYETDLTLQYPAHVIAAACLYVAAAWSDKLSDGSALKAFLADQEHSESESWPVRFMVPLLYVEGVFYESNVLLNFL